ncbi:HAD family hydrolase [Streptococcus acidominimus]|uniref:HAD family hydrolase n=1 Tax=Streptococcus acidominimus TaxID=1326 RepID=A0A4Y9FRD1_STRAI|nr:HAD family hydrolase [Streptococcus acidominimus]MBF0818041.1 HAD family hydrolase [Streptococcus acidominimus]MBF0838765.1 HAD family hydrolase [Streptococcus acidominimus]MBF0847512.1 HAD family hydrolase [Streptococcus danieliae]TFU31761.1 HAD family hydrolase [Streptococcus acidominimus]
MLSWIFFDVGSTLVDETLTYQRFANECSMTLREYGKEVTAADFFAKMQELAALGEPPIRNAWAWYGLPSNIRPHWNYEGETLYPDVDRILDYLAQSYRLGIIANQNRGLEQRLESFGIRHFFNLIVCSEEVGYQKPNRALFDYTLRQVKSPAGDCLYIGDRMDNDILPAKRVGMRTVHVLQGIGPHHCQQAGITADFTVQCLSDLMKLF